MEGVGVVFVGALGGPFEPGDAFACVGWDAEQSFETDHAYFVHCWTVAHSGRALVELDGTSVVSSRAASAVLPELAAYCDPIGGLRMPEFRC